MLLAVALKDEDGQIRYGNELVQQYKAVLGAKGHSKIGSNYVLSLLTQLAPCTLSRPTLADLNSC